MSAWATSTIGDICTFNYGKALRTEERTGSGFTVYGSNGPVGAHKKAITNGPTIVIGRKGSLGEVHYSEEPCWPIDTTYYINQDSTKVDLRWLYHLLKAKDLTSMNRSAAIPGLNRDDAYRLGVLVPPLAEQRRIANVLDHADSIRVRRSESLRLAETLTTSIFEASFGSPVSNPRFWPDDKVLGDVAHIVSGVTKGRRVRDERVRTVPYLAVANVQAGHLRLDGIKTIDATEAEIARYRLVRGDIVLTEGGDPDKLGRGSVWSGEIAECIHQNHVFRVRVYDTGFNPFFVASLLASQRGRRYFLRAAKQTTGIASINKSQLSEFPLLAPPRDIQDRFLNQLQAQERLSRQARSHDAGLDSLFATLQHRAFAGEL